MAKAGVRRVTTAAEDIDTLHHHALVQANRSEPGRLADHRSTTERTAGSGQRLGPGHRAFFVAGGQDDQRLLERLVDQAAHRFDRQREEAFHVAAAKPDPAAIHLGELERIGAPQGLVVRHRIAVPGQHQPSRTTAKRGNQVELAGIDLLDVAGEPQLGKPGGQQVDHLAIGLVQAGLGAADRRRGDQGGELFLHGWQWHGDPPGRAPS